MSEATYEFEYEPPINAQESYDWVINEPDLDSWFIELLEQGL